MCGVPLLGADIKSEHVDAISNLSFQRADITAPGYPQALAAAIDAAMSGAGMGGGASSDAPMSTADGPSSPCSGSRRCVAVGMHLCGQLSPCAIELFAATSSLAALILVPCCLDKRVDGALKMEARLLGIDPYEAKVRQLSAMLKDRVSADVEVIRDGSMRTQGGGEVTEGSDAAKNALIVGRKR